MFGSSLPEIAGYRRPVLAEPTLIGAAGPGRRGLLMPDARRS